LAEDHLLMRAGVRLVLQAESDFEVVGETAGGSDVLAKAIALRPDVILMDVVLAGGDGVEATRAIRARCPDIHILILTAYADAELFKRAIEAGAAGYVLKDIAPAHLCAAIRAVSNGTTMLNPGLARQMLDYLYASANAMPAAVPRAVEPRQSRPLTPRETGILVEVARGLSDKEIASKFLLSEYTVKSHLRTLYQRLRFRNRAHAAAYAIQHGLVLEAETTIRGAGQGPPWIGQRDVRSGARRTASSP